MVNRKQRSTRCARNRMQGGGLGNGYHLGAEMLTRGYAINEPYSSCGALARPGVMSTDVTGSMGKGLPGLAGGGRRRRGNKRTQRKQRGGRYDMVMSGAEFSALGPRGGMMATAMRAPCEAGQGSPLPSPTQLTAPAFRGGAQLAPAPFLQEQTAGYTQMSSKWLDSVGAPVQLHEPVGGRMASPACGQTGGKRKQRGGEGEGEGESNDVPNPGNTPEETANILARYAAAAAQKAAAAQEAVTALRAAAADADAAARQEATQQWLNEYQQHMNAVAREASGGAEAAAAAYVSLEAGKHPLNNVVGIQSLTKGGRRKNRKASRKQRKSSRKASRKQRK